MIKSIITLADDKKMKGGHLKVNRHSCGDLNHYGQDI